MRPLSGLSTLTEQFHQYDNELITLVLWYILIAGMAFFFLLNVIGLLTHVSFSLRTLRLFMYSTKNPIEIQVETALDILINFGGNDTFMIVSPPKKIVCSVLPTFPSMRYHFLHIRTFLQNVIFFVIVLNKTFPPFSYLCACCKHREKFCC